MEGDGIIKVFDTTLRDGQQCPGAGMSPEKNLEYAHLAAELRVDILEAGFPSASKLDAEIVSRICTELGSYESSPTIAALCQLRSEQIDITMEALAPALARGKARLHTYVPVDPELMRASLGERADRKGEIVEDLFTFVRRAVGAGLEVQFSPEGYSRMGANFGFVTDLFRAAVSAGAAIINCPDTIGGASRWEGPEYFVEKMKEHAAIIAREFPDRKIVWSVHCHNDFGLAVDNTIHAVFDGPARQIEGCMNGIGERAGNAALEQCAMVIQHFARNACRAKGQSYSTNLDLSKLQKVSNFVRTNMLPRQPHWPVTGDNATKHSSGGHTNAILKNPMAYQPYDPKVIGREIRLVFGPLSGGNHAKSLIEEQGYVCGDQEKAEIAQFIKNQYSDRRKGITDDELLAAYRAFRSPIQVESFRYGKAGSRSEVSVDGRFFGETKTVHEFHDGQDSALAALKRLIDRMIPGLDITSHSSQSDGEGITARSLSKVVVRLASGEHIAGEGADRDIEISAMKALIDAANRAYVEHHFRLPAESKMTRTDNEKRAA